MTPLNTSVLLIYTGGTIGMIENAEMWRKLVHIIHERISSNQINVPTGTWLYTG